MNHSYTDQLGKKIDIKAIPSRIISLVPSQTELLYALGLTDEVIGITKFCIHPESWFRNKTRVGGTKTIDIEKIKQLEPHLIIANKEENVKEQINALQTVAPVWVSDVNNLDDALQMIKCIGKMVGKQNQAALLNKRISEGFDELSSEVNKAGLQNAAYMIWKDPYMTVGGDTFINDILQRCGLKNVFENKKRYPEVTLQELKSVGCNLVLLSSEPYPFKEKHIKEIQTVLPEAKVLLVDGEMFSWYGSRLQFAPSYFKQLLADL